MRLWIILLIAVAAAVAAGAPIATPVTPDWWQPVPAGSVRYLTLVSPKPWSDTVTVTYAAYTSSATFTPSWTNTTATYYFAPWAARHQITSSTTQTWFTIRYAFSQPTFIAVRPFITAPSSYAYIVVVVANATTVGQVGTSSSTCPALGSSALGGVVIACFSGVGTGSEVMLQWVNASYVTSIAICGWSANALGAVIDISRRVWIGAAGLTVPGSGRSPVYAAVANVSGVYASFTPAPSDIWIHEPTQTTAVYYTNVVWTAPTTIAPGAPLNVVHRYRLTVWESVTLTHVYPDGSSASISVAAGDYYIIDNATAPAYITASTSRGWVKVVEPQWDEHIRLAPIPSQQWITFYINDYGQGFTQLRVYTQDGRIAWRDEISAVTQSAVARLAPYGVYVIALWKPGEERALGPIIIDKTSFTLTVLPTPRQVPPMSFASVTYNQTIGAYIIDVYCRLPPCNITLTKMTVGSTTVVSYVCTSSYCRFTWQTEDPFLRVTVTDASGNTYNAFAGTSLNMTPSQVESFQRVFSKIAEHFAMFDNANGVKFAAALLGVLIFLALTIPGFLMVGLIVLAIYNAVVGMLLGFTLLSATALPIIVIIGILHYIAKHA